MRAVLNSDNATIIYCVFAVARLASSVCSSSGKFASPENQVGNAPLRALSDAGIRRLLDRPDAGRCNFGTVGMVAMLKLEFASLDLSNRASKDGLVDDTKEDRQRLLSAAGEAMTSALGLGATSGANRTHVAQKGPDKSGGAADLRPGHHTTHNHSGLSDDRASSLINLIHSDPTQRQWVCSNPACVSAHSTTRLMRCACALSHYCSVACQ